MEWESNNEELGTVILFLLDLSQQRCAGNICEM